MATTIGDGLKATVAMLVGLAVAGLMFGGIYHAGQEHGVGDCAVAIFLPPFAVYRGLECLLWHEDSPEPTK